MSRPGDELSSEVVAVTSIHYHYKEMAWLEAQTVAWMHRPAATDKTTSSGARN